MKPAVCCICGKIPATAHEGDWLEFQDYQSEGIGMSHPAGLEYFCDEHVAAGRRFIAMTAAEALKKIKDLK